MKEAIISDITMKILQEKAKSGSTNRLPITISRSVTVEFSDICKWSTGNQEAVNRLLSVIENFKI